MTSSTSRRAPLALRALLPIFALAAALSGLLAPTAAIADAVTDPTGDAVAYSWGSDGKATLYYSLQDALEAGYSGNVICMLKDWELNETLYIADSKSIAIDMRGHEINSNGADGVIRLYENSSLTLQSSDASCTKTFTYSGYSFDSAADQASKASREIETGGLVTGGDSDSNVSGGITMDAGSALTLDNVAVAGNRGQEAGGVYAKKNCTINMRNGAAIENNVTPLRGAGGVMVDGDDVTINMDNSKINDNIAVESGGGGIRSNADATRIYMTNGASITNNTGSNGGGVYFRYSFFALESSDGTGVISGNYAHRWWAGLYEGGGGGVYVDSRIYGQNEGTIKGLTITGNSSRGYAGGIYLEQEYTNVIDCSITNNKCVWSGGGVYIDNDECTLNGCTITGNACDSNAGVGADGEGGGDGGGIYATSGHDVRLFGTTYIRNNTRGSDNSADDLFLDSDAYIIGDPVKGSDIGIRTASTEDRKVGEDLNSELTEEYFMDLGDTYRAAFNGSGINELWQRSGASNLNITVNGEAYSTCRYRGTATIKDPNTDAGRVFKCWSADESTGLDPFSGYVTDIYSSAVSFTMPNNDVNLVAEYVARVSGVTMSVDKPEAGKALAATAKLTWAFGEADVPITWYDQDGSVVTTAEVGRTYHFTATVAQDVKNDLAFELDMDENGVVVDCGGMTGTASEASVDSAGTLTMTSKEYSTEKGQIESVTAASIVVTEGTSKSDLLDMLPATADVNLAGDLKFTLKTNKDQVKWADDLFKTDEVYGEIVYGEVGKSYDVELPLVSDDQIADAEKSFLTVSVTVLPDTGVNSPVLNPAAGTYDTSDAQTPVKDLALTVKANCSTARAVIKYQVNDGVELEYDSAAGIELKGEANAKTTFTVKAWAINSTTTGEVVSEPVEATYVIDDTQNKTISIPCADTALYGEGDEHWGDSISVTGNLGCGVAVTAPAESGRVFSHWAWADAPEGVDLTQSTLVIPSFSLDCADKITAVYEPVVTKINLVFDAPEADKALATNATNVKIAVDGPVANTEITKYFADDAAITWSPSATESGNAAHGTVYTASLSFGSGQATDGVAYALADDVKLLVNGKDLGGSAYIATDASGNKLLCATMPETAAAKYQSIETPADTKLSFEQACNYQASAEAGDSASWGLDSTVKVNYQCGETGYANVTWEQLTDFDKGATEEQTLTFGGKLTYPDGIDADGQALPETVTANVVVAAPRSVAAPKASVASGTYKQAQTVELSCSTDGATIRYTTDGSDPTATSAEYTGAITVSTGTTIKARAFRDNMADSDVSTFEYTIVHEVTFDSAGGSNVLTQEVKDGETAYEPPAPTQDDLKFDYWALADGTKYDFNTAVTSDVTLYAHWTAAASPAVCLVIFNSAPGSVVASQTVLLGDCVERPADPTLAGFTFGGWTDEDGNPYDFSKPATTSFTLYATWSTSEVPTETHVVTFDSAGGTSVELQVVGDSWLVKKPADPTMDGYTFVGWYLADGVTEFDFDTPVTSSFTLYAKWAKDETPDPTPEPTPTETFAVIFDTRGGSSVATQTVVSGACATKPADPTRQGYTFAGWYADEALTSEFDFSGAVTGNVTVYAKWTADATPIPSPTPGGSDTKTSGGSKAATPSTGDTALSSPALTIAAVSGVVLAACALVMRTRKNR